MRSSPQERLTIKLVKREKNTGYSKSDWESLEADGYG